MVNRIARHLPQSHAEKAAGWSKQRLNYLFRKHVHQHAIDRGETPPKESTIQDLLACIVGGTLRSEGLGNKLADEATAMIRDMNAEVLRTNINSGKTVLWFCLGHFRCSHGSRI